MKNLSIPVLLTASLASSSLFVSAMETPAKFDPANPPKILAKKRPETNTTKPTYVPARKNVSGRPASELDDPRRNPGSKSLYIPTNTRFTRLRRQPPPRMHRLAQASVGQLDTYQPSQEPAPFQSEPINAYGQNHEMMMPNYPFNAPPPFWGPIPMMPMEPQVFAPSFQVQQRSLQAPQPVAPKASAMSLDAPEFVPATPKAPVSAPTVPAPTPVPAPAPTPVSAPTPVPTPQSQPVVSRVPAFPEYNLGNVYSVLPDPLCKSIDFLSRGKEVKAELVTFFNFMNQNIPSNLAGTVETIRTTMAHVTQLLTQADSLNQDFLVALDSYLRCYTAAYLICTPKQRAHLFKRDLVDSIEDVTGSIRQDDLYVGMKRLVDGLIEEGRISKERFYHLGISFIRYFKCFRSTQLMAGAFQFNIELYINVAEELLENMKTDLISKKQFIRTTEDFLSSTRRPGEKFTGPAYAYNPKESLSMLIAPFRILVTRVFHSHLPKTVAEKELKLFWKLTETAFVEFDFIRKHSWATSNRKSEQAVRQMQWDFLGYLLDAQIFGNIQLALSRVNGLEEVREELYDIGCSLLTIFFNYDLSNTYTQGKSRASLLPDFNAPLTKEDILEKEFSALIAPMNAKMHFVRNKLTPTSPQAPILGDLANSMLALIDLIVPESDMSKVQFLVSLEEIQNMPYSPQESQYMPYAPQGVQNMPYSPQAPQENQFIALPRFYSYAQNQQQQQQQPWFPPQYPGNHYY